MAALIKEHPITKLKKRYPQLNLSIKIGMSSSQEYTDVVAKGNRPVFPIENFSMSENDELMHFSYSVGTVDCIFLYQRDDFEKFIQIMAYRCEPRTIPRSMGASLITGIPSKTKKTDALIVLTEGPYSNVSHDHTRYNENQWLAISKKIRIYHELTHFICKKKYPALKNNLCDEIFSDYMGLLFSVNEYDRKIALRFLGFNKSTHEGEGRLGNYLPIEQMNNETWDYITKLSSQLEGLNITNPIDDDFEQIIDDVYLNLKRI